MSMNSLAVGFRYNGTPAIASNVSTYSLSQQHFTTVRISRSTQLIVVSCLLAISGYRDFEIYNNIDGSFITR